jgi:hypothetical protein
MKKKETKKGELTGRNRMMKEIVGVKRSGLNRKDKIRWNRKTSNHIFKDQSLMFKFLPLRHCER